MHPIHSKAGSTDVLVVNAPFALVVTSTTPVNVATPPVGSAEVKVVVYLVHPEHTDSAITEVSVVKAPFEFVVTITSPVTVFAPPVESVEMKVVVYSVHPEHSEEDEGSERTEVRVTKTPLEFVVTSTSPVNVTREL